MATLGTQYYNNEADTSAKNSFILKDTDMFIMQIGEEGTNGVESESSNDITFTPSTAPTTFGTDTYNSTVGLNLLVTGATSTLWYGPVKDTTSTTLVFDCTTMFNVSSGSAGTASDWASAATYSWRVHYPSAYGLYGDYFGHVKEISLEPKEEIIQFKKGVPRELIVQDTLEWSYAIKGKNFTPNAQVFRSVLNGTSYGSQTSQTETHFGFAPATRAQFKVTLVGQNRAGYDMIWEFFICQFAAEGSIDFSAEEYKGLPFTLNVFKDALRGDARNAFRLVQDS